MGGGGMHRSTFFLTSALVGGEWSASRFCRFTPGERAPCTHWIGGWVNPRAVLDNVEKRNSWPHRDTNSDPSVVQPVASRYTDYAILASTHNINNTIINNKTCGFITRDSVQRRFWDRRATTSFSRTSSMNAIIIAASCIICLARVTNTTLHAVCESKGETPASQKPDSCPSHFTLIFSVVLQFRPPLWSSGQSSWLRIQRSPVRFTALQDFLRSSGSGTESTQPREGSWGATWMEK
jgi:hypothetical protein